MRASIFVGDPVEEEDFCFLCYFCILLHLVRVKPPLATTISGYEAIKHHNTLILTHLVPFPEVNLIKVDL